MKRHATVGLAVAGALVGCGGKKGVDYGGVSIADAPQEIAKAVCPKAHVCCQPMQLMGNDLAGKDEPDCEVKTAEGFRKNLDGLRGSIDKERAVYRGDKLATCLAYIRSAKCEELNRTNHFTGIGCEPWVQPLVAVGGTCGADHDCIESFCKKQPMAWEGVCQPWPKAGESCADVRCDKGLICHGDTKTCATTLADGAMCTSSLQCASLECTDPFGTGTSTCAPPRPDKCFYASACSYGQAPPSSFAAALALAALALALRRRRPAH